MAIPIPNANDINSVARTTLNVAKAAKVMYGSLGRTSVTRLAKESILEIPLIISSSIGTDETITISRGIEKYYAAGMVSLFSMRTVDLNKNDSVADFIKRYHNNNDIPTNIKAISSAFESAHYETNPALMPAIVDILACWNMVTEQVDMTSLNDVYNPYEKTKALLIDKIGKLETANEAVSPVFDRGSTLNAIANSIGNSVNDGYQGTRTTDRTNNHETSTVTKYDRNGTRTDTTITDKCVETRVQKQVNPNTFNGIVKNDKLTALEPTMINVQFIVHGGDGDSKNFLQNVVLGIKAMIRPIRSDLLVANMAEASKNSNVIFKFIKWTKGEYKFVRDFIFNVSEIKENAIGGKDSKNFLSALKRRKSINSVSKFFDNRVPPSSVIIMTSYEVARVAEMTGVDLNEIHNALNLLNKYYLMGFGIYNTETKILSTVFDGYSEFSDTTIEALRVSTSKNSDMISMSDAMKAFGRI